MPDKQPNKGQGKAGGALNEPANIPSQMSGTPHGSDISGKLDNVSRSPKETKEAGIGGNYPGSNVGNFN